MHMGRLSPALRVSSAQSAGDLVAGWPRTRMQVKAQGQRAGVFLPWPWSHLAGQSTDVRGGGPLPSEGAVTRADIVHPFQ